MVRKGRFTGFAAVAGAVVVLASLAAPAAAFTQKGVGVVTALKGSVNVAHTPDVAARERRPAQEALKFRDDVFFLDTIRTEREATAKLLLRARSTFTIRELSQVQLREGPAPAPGATRSIVNILAGALRAIVQRELRPQDEMEIHTPNAISAVRGTDIVVEVYRDTAPPLPPGAYVEPEVRPVSYEVAQAQQAQVGQFISRWFVLLGELAVEGLVARTGEGIEKIGTQPARLFRFLPDFVRVLVARFAIASGVGPAGAHAAQIVAGAQGQAVAEGRGAGAGFATPTAAVLPVERAITPLNTSREIVTTATYTGNFFVSSFSASGSGIASPGPLGGSFDFQMMNTSSFSFSPPPSPICSPFCSGSLQGTARLVTQGPGGPGVLTGSFSGPVSGGGSVAGTFKTTGTFTSGSSTSNGTLNLNVRGGVATVPIKLTTD